MVNSIYCHKKVSPMNLQEKLPVIYLFSLSTHNYWLVIDSSFGSQLHADVHGMMEC